MPSCQIKRIMPTIKLPNKRKRTFNGINKGLYQKVYQDRRWKRLRAAKKRNNSLCEHCLARGIIKQMDEVHHIIPFDINDYERLAFDYDNLVSLCVECHRAAHRKLG